MKKIAIFCLLLWGCATQQYAEPSMALSVEVLEKAQEFRSLRVIKGHFTGGTWNAPTDAFNGQRHQVMLALEQDLRGAMLTAEQLEHLLGEADAIRPLPTGELGEQWVYFWRGWHDYLFFTLVPGQPLQVDWYFAYE